MMVALLLWVLAALAAPGSELVLVLDNRAALERGPLGRGQERAAAALMRALEGTDARVTVVGLAPEVGEPPEILTEPEQVEALAPVGEGSLLPALYAARAVLETSARERRAAVVLIHGEPAGAPTPEALRRALAVDAPISLAWVGLGEGGAAARLASSPWVLETAVLDPEAVSAALRRASRPALPLPARWPAGVVARMSLPEEALAGRTVAVRGWLERDGQVLDPRSLFLGSFDARFEVGGTAQPFELQADGRWSARWTPPGPEGLTAGSFRVRDADVELQASASVWVDGEFGPLLRMSPDTVDLGRWESGPSATRRCAELDLSGSARAEQLDVLCQPSAPGRVTLLCSPAPGQEGASPVLRWQVCAQAPPCCADAPEPGDDPLSVRFVQRDEGSGHLLATIPVIYAVEGQSLLLCRGPGVLVTLVLAGGVLALLGLRRAPRFAPGLSVRLASSEPGLRRARPLLLGRLASDRRPLWPGPVPFDERGDPALDLEGAALVLEPTTDGAARVARGERLERRLASSAGWAPVDETERIAGLQVDHVYRVGERIYFILS